MVFLIKLVSRLPLWWLYGISNVLYVLVYHVLGYRKKIVYKNLNNSFPDYSHQEIEKIAKQFYKRFADFAMETLKSFTIPAHRLNRRVRFTNMELMEDFQARGLSVVIACNHQFNWEWALLGGCLQLPFPVDGIYQKLSNTKIDRLVLQSRSRFGGHMIEKKHAFRSIIKRKGLQKCIAINADQVPGESTKIHWARMLHQDTAFFQGLDVIPRITDSAVVFMKILSPKRGYFDIEFVPIGEPPYTKGETKVLDRYIDVSERLIIDDPSGWLWSHRRWKREKPKEMVQ